MRRLATVFAAIAACAADPAPPSGQHTMHRAGHPHCIAPWATWGRSPKATGGQVGGGTLCRGGPPAAGDGTWGYDYVGHGYWPSRIFSNWYADGVRQRPMGPYKIDGGPHVPDVFAIKPIKRAVERHRAEPAESHAESDH